MIEAVFSRADKTSGTFNPQLLFSSVYHLLPEDKWPDRLHLLRAVREVLGLPEQGPLASCAPFFDLNEDDVMSLMSQVHNHSSVDVSVKYRAGALRDNGGFLDKARPPVDRVCAACVSTHKVAETYGDDEQECHSQVGSERFHAPALTPPKPEGKPERLRLDCRNPRAAVLFALLAQFHARSSDLSCLFQSDANLYTTLSMFDFFCDMVVKAKTGKTLTIESLMTGQPITIKLDYNRFIVSALRDHRDISPAPFIKSEPYT